MPPTTREPTMVVTPAERDRVLTVPNLLSLLRLLGVPLFLWLLLGPHADLAALGVLAFAGISDYADGKLARLLNQTSRIGTLLDPAADRLYILATLLAFCLRGIIPWWLAGVIVGRDVLLGGCLVILRRYGYGPPQVHYLGKAATLNLLYAFPLLLLGTRTGTVGDIARPIGWAFTIWGTALYVWAGILYVYQVALLVRAASAPRSESPAALRREAAAGPGSAAPAAPRPDATTVPGPGDPTAFQPDPPRAPESDAPTAPRSDTSSPARRDTSDARRPETPSTASADPAGAAEAAGPAGTTGTAPPAGLAGPAGPAGVARPGEAPPAGKPGPEGPVDRVAG